MSVGHWRLWLGAFTFLSMTATNASARSWSDTAGWTIIEGDSFCGMSLEYEGKGETELTVAKFLDGSALLLVTNGEWSAKKDQLYDLRFYVGTDVFSGGQSRGTGEAFDRKGFATKFEPGFFKSFSTGSGLKIYMGETLIDSLQLKGSAAAMVTVDRCLASVKAISDAAERERRRLAHIPVDPFASTVPSSTTRDDPPERDWISVDDYPPSSLRENEEGTTKVRYTVNAQGRVEKCVVTSSSGSDALDRATCAAITRRGRFTPAADTRGTATSYDRAFSFTWKIPKG